MGQYNSPLTNSTLLSEIYYFLPYSLNPFRGYNRVKYNSFCCYKYGMFKCLRNSQSNLNITNPVNVAVHINKLVVIVRDEWYLLRCSVEHKARKGWAVASGCRVCVEGSPNLAR